MNEEVESAVKQATNEIQRHSVALLTNAKGLIGTGTLVRIGKVHGILTAGHVAAQVGAKDWLGVTVEDRLHGFYLPSGLHNREMVKVGPWDGTDREEGPDLEFIQIINPDSISTIAAKKHFYPLLERGFPDLTGPSNAGWFVAGSPGKFAKLAPSPEAGSVDEMDKLEMLVRRAEFLGNQERGKFDFISFRLPKGGEFYPASYGGVSGGGFWKVTFKKNAQGVLIPDAPLLVGVAYYEGDFDQPAARLVGHGPRSVHTILQESLGSQPVRPITSTDV